MNHQYSGIVVNQRPEAGAPAFFVFVAPAKEVLLWADAEPTAWVAGGAQRLYSKPHGQAIDRFLSSSKKNIIPTAVILSLPPRAFKIDKWDVEKVEQPTRTSFATLTIELPRNSTTKLPGTVIDGQHRLKILSSRNLLTVAAVILGADRMENAIHFVVINSKAKKVPRDLTRAIVAELDEPSKERFLERVTSMGVALEDYASATRVLAERAESPFFELVDWDLNRKGARVVKPAAIEQALRVIQADLAGDGELDSALALLSAMWRGVRSAWGDGVPKWGEKTLRLHQKAVIVAVTEFLVERFNHQVEDRSLDLDELDDVEARAQGILQSIPRDFWTESWRETGLDTTAGRDLIKKALADVRQRRTKSQNPLDGAAWFFAEKPGGADPTQP